MKKPRIMLKSLRMMANWSHRQVMVKTAGKVSDQVLQRWEDGSRGEKTFNAFFSLCDLYNIETIDQAKRVFLS